MDLLAGLEGCLDRALIGCRGRGDPQPLGGKLFLGADLDGLTAAAGEFVVGEGEAVGCWLQPCEHKDQGGFEGIGPALIALSQLHQEFGLLLAVAALGPEVVDHPASGIGLKGQGFAVAFLNEEGFF